MDSRIRSHLLYRRRVRSLRLLSRKPSGCNPLPNPRSKFPWSWPRELLTYLSI